MSERTNIAWCDSTLNFWIGCTKVSPGCAHCYADEQDARRFSMTLGGATKVNPIRHWGEGAPRYKSQGAVRDALTFNRKPWICDECGEALSLEQVRSGAAITRCKCGSESRFHRRRIFSLSLGDWLDDEVPIEWLAEMLQTMQMCDQCVWILCTKRPENWRTRLEAVAKETDERVDFSAKFGNWLNAWIEDEPPANIILLTSVEDQAAADKRIPELLKIPAACRGLSLEPLLGSVDVALKQRVCGMTRQEARHKLNNPTHYKAELDWLIIGGESGSNARCCNVDWIRSLVEQGKAAGVATFVKQLGADARYNTTGEVVPLSGPLTGKENVLIKNSPMYLKDKKGSDPAEWPADLRIQQWPEGLQ